MSLSLPGGGAWRSAGMSPRRPMGGRKRRWTRRGSIGGPEGAPMNQREESWCRLREQQRVTRAAAAAAAQQQRRSSDTEDKQMNMHEPRYLESWIVNLLLEYRATETREDDQLGHILKVLEETKALQHNEESPVASLCIADGHHYIRAVVTAKAVQRTKCPLLQSGFSNVTGQFIVLRNYRVCFKESSVMEDCEFYLLLEHFRVIPMKRQEMKQLDCNREPSVLQKIKELWLRSLALQPWSSSEPSSVSDVLREIKQDQLSTLKQNVEDCISLLDPGQMLDSEQLAVYPDTKWQTELRNDKNQHHDTFTVPSKLLMISDEDEAALRKACSATAESENLDDSLENPWDMFPRMTLSSSTDVSGTAPSLPNTQQVLLANTAEEEETPCSSSCTPDLLVPHAHVPHCGSDQASSGKTVLPTSRQSANQETIAAALNTACEESRISDIDGRIPCVQPLNSPSSDTMCLPSADLSARKDLFIELSSDSTEEDRLAHSHRKMAVVVKETGERDIQASRRCLIAKRKKLTSEEEELIEISSSPDCMSYNSPEQPSSAFPKPINLESQKSPLVRLVSLPKKSRVKEIQKSQQQMLAQVRGTNGLREKRREEKEVATRRPGKHPGHKQLDCRRRAPFQVAFKPVTPDLCSKVCSTRISRALLGWARWVFSNMQKQ